jgi:hypothetical protein
MTNTPSPNTEENPIDDEIMSLVPERFREGVLSGALKVEPREKWYNPEKPVIFKVAGHRIVAGRYINANDAAAVSRATSYKRTTSYRQMLENLVPMDGDENTRGSFAWCLKQFFQACEGSPQLAPCPHPDICPQGGKPHVIAFKREAGPMFKLIELMAGKAKETQEVNVNSRQLIALLNDPTPMTELTVIDLPPDQARERKKLLESGPDA